MNDFKNKKKILFALFLLLLFIFFIYYVIFSKNDGMKNIKDIHIYYRTYSNSKWSKWSKDGIISGNKKEKIEKIEIKISSNNKKFKNYRKNLTYSIYSIDDDWSKDFYASDKSSKFDEIRAITIENLGSVRKQFDIYYRTYNLEDKWLQWTFNGEISGNKNQNVTAIEIKIVPKNIVVEEYLKDYSKNNKPTKIGF